MIALIKIKLILTSRCTKNKVLQLHEALKLIYCRLEVKSQKRALIRNAVDSSNEREWGCYNNEAKNKSYREKNEIIMKKKNASGSNFLATGDKGL